MKYLNEILEEHDVLDEVYPPFPEDEKRFKEKHTITKFKNFYSSPEYDALFKGASMKKIDRHKDNHGFNDNEDEKFYESFNEFIGDLVEDGYTDEEILALAEHAFNETVKLDDDDINDPNFQKALTGFKKVYGKYVDEYGQESAVRHAKDMLEKNYDPNIRNKIETYLGLNEVMEIDENARHVSKAIMRTAKDFPGGVHAVLGPLAAVAATHPHLFPSAIAGTVAAVAATAGGIKLMNHGKPEDQKYVHPVVKSFNQHLENVKNEVNESSSIATQVVKDTIDAEEDEFPSKAVKRFRELSKNPSSNGLKLKNGSTTNNDVPTSPREDQEIKRTNEDVVDERNTNGFGGGCGQVLSYDEVNKKGTGQAPDRNLHHILKADGSVHFETNETGRAEEHFKSGGKVYFRPGHKFHKKS